MRKTVPYSVQHILREFIDVIRHDYFTLPSEERIPGPPQPILSLVNRDEYWSVLPSFWFWFPIRSTTRSIGRETIRQIRASVNYFPHVGVIGHSRWVDFALGGAMMQIITYRLFVIVAAPPAVDIIEKLNNTLAFISFIILNRHQKPPLWWFTTVSEVEPVARSNLFPQWTVGVLSGEIRCQPQVLPFLTPPQQ